MPPLTAPACPERGRGDPASQTCQHINARGRRCRLLPAADSTLCPHHARRHAPSQPSDEAVAAELLAGIDDPLVALRQVASAASVNLFLGHLLQQLARKRIRRPDAVALAYICQLLLNSLAAMNRERSQASGESHPEICVINDIVPVAERRAALALDTGAPKSRRTRPLMTHTRMEEKLAPRFHTAKPFPINQNTSTRLNPPEEFRAIVFLSKNIERCAQERTEDGIEK